MHAVGGQGCGEEGRDWGSCTSPEPNDAMSASSPSSPSFPAGAYSQRADTSCREERAAAARASGRRPSQTLA